MNSRSIGYMISGAVLAGMAVAAHAQVDTRELSTSSPTDGLYACQSIVDEGERLVCFDNEVAALKNAEEVKDIRIIDRAEVKEARRGLFGFSLPKLGIFGEGDDEDEDSAVERVTELEEPLVSFGTTSTGKAYFTIESGARWVQTDGRPVLGSPEAGEMVKIEEAALGSYKASIGSRRAIRVRRVN